MEDVATGTLLGGGATMVASVAALFGIVTIIWRRRGGWMIACALIAAALYVVAVVMYQGRFRHFTIGSWYQDPYRLAALVPLFMIVLASVGADGLVSAVRGWLRRIGAKHRPADGLASLSSGDPGACTPSQQLRFLRSYSPPWWIASMTPG